jgi:hypothetical protein
MHDLRTSLPCAVSAAECVRSDPREDFRPNKDKFYGPKHESSLKRAVFVCRKRKCAIRIVGQLVNGPIRTLPQANCGIFQPNASSYEKVAKRPKLENFQSYALLFVSFKSVDKRASY